MEPFALHLAVAVTAMIGALSLLVKTEIIRGLGRCVTGISIALMAVLIYSNTADTSEPQILTGLLCLAGLITLLSGVRKFVRNDAN